MHATHGSSRRRLTINVIPYAFIEVHPFSFFYGGGDFESRLCSFRCWRHPFKTSSLKWVSWVFNFSDLCRVNSNGERKGWEGSKD